MKTEICAAYKERFAYFWQNIFFSLPSHPSHPFTGAYRYIDSREDKNFEKRNKTAIFASPSLKASAQQQNMKFAYSMDGKDVGSLRVLFVDQSANKETVAFEKKGNQGKGPAWSWFDTCVDLPTSGTYKVCEEWTVESF